MVAAQRRTRASPCCSGFAAVAAVAARRAPSHVPPVYQQQLAPPPLQPSTLAQAHLFEVGQAGRQVVEPCSSGSCTDSRAGVLRAAPILAIRAVTSFPT